MGYRAVCDRVRQAGNGGVCLARISCVRAEPLSLHVLWGIETKVM